MMREQPRVLRPSARFGLVGVCFLLALLAARLDAPEAMEGGRLADDADPVVVPISLRIMVSTEADLTGLRGLALADIAKTNALFETNGVGIRVEAIDTIVLAAGPTLTSISNCIAGDTLSPGSGLPDVLHVYYLNYLTGTLRGTVCDDTDQRRFRVAFIGFQNHAETTLAHEMSHALGLTVPGVGHTDDLPGFTVRNLMRSGLNDADATARNSLSAGQVFRMRNDAGSWLNRGVDQYRLPLRAATAPPMACQCGMDDPAGPCPRLRDGPDPAPAARAPANGPACKDVVLMPASYADGHPVALLAGREWRDPPGVCRVVSSEVFTVGSNAVQFQFDNVTRPGTTCPSWVAMFAAGHGAYFAGLQELPGVFWSAAADRWAPGRGAAAPRAVEVRLFGAAAGGARVKTDSSEAVQVFGDASRAGIHLTVTRQPSSASCPTDPRPAARELTTLAIDVCYGSWFSNADLPGTMIRLPAAATASYSLPHAMGAALGLPQAPDLPENVMQPAGPARGPHLTLGQLFWLNAALRPDFPDCADTPAACPSVAFDGTP